MRRYIVTIEETCSDDFCVEANSLQDAMRIAKEKYNSGEFVLEPGNLLSKQMQCTCEETNEDSEWMEF